MKTINKHPYHILAKSQLPFLASGFAMLSATNVVFYLHPSKNSCLNNWDTFTLHISIIALNLVALSWFIMIIFESGQGFHTLMVQKGLRFGFWLFLVSEAMLFFSFFWGYFHFSLNPSIAMGHQWPAALGIQQINPYEIALLNTILLLSSGATATMAHRAILTTDFFWNNMRQFLFFIALMATITIAYLFLSCQAIEYCYGLQQSWMSNVYWSIFFMLTGFHGVHVIIGTIFLQVNYFRQYFLGKNLEILFFLLAASSYFYSKYWQIHITIYRLIKGVRTPISRYFERPTPNPIVVKNPELAWAFLPLLPSPDAAKADKVRQRVNKGLVKMSQNIHTTLMKDPRGSLDTSYLLLPQLSRYSASTSQHLGLEAALYYWHFVDAIWILLYMIVYQWGT